MYVNTNYIRFFSKALKYKIVFFMSNMHFEYMYLKHVSGFLGAKPLLHLYVPLYGPSPKGT